MPDPKKNVSTSHAQKEFFCQERALPSRLLKLRPLWKQRDKDGGEIKAHMRSLTTNLDRDNLLKGLRIYMDLQCPAPSDSVDSNANSESQYH